MFKLIKCGFVICLAVMLASHVQASGEQGAWRIREIPGLVQYITHGTTVYGHEFGFVKLAGRCNKDILWLSWSTDDPKIKNFIGSKATISIDLNGKTLKMNVTLKSVRRFTPMTTIAVFNKSNASPDFIELLNQGKEMVITISGPVNKFLDIRHDKFSLEGFAVARQQAKKICEDRLASNVAPLAFGSS